MMWENSLREEFFEELGKELGTDFGRRVVRGVDRRFWKRVKNLVSNQFTFICSDMSV